MSTFTERIPAPAAADIAVPPRRVRSILRILVMATFVVILNETIMVNAIPRLMQEFAVPAGTAQWLSTAFMLTMAAVIPASGWFLQRVTTRWAFGLALGLFSTGTLLATVAWAFPVLLVARVIQASGTAVMMPLLMTTLLTLVPAESRGRVMGSVTLAMSVAPALGPAVSGLILQFGSWRMIFAVTLPIAAVMALVGLRRLVDIGETRRSGLDGISLVLAGLGFGSLIYGLSQLGAEAHAGGLPAGPMVAAGAVSVCGFVVRQLLLQRRDAALLDLRAFTNRQFTLSLSLMCLAFMALMGSMIILPIFLQSVAHYSILTTGLLMMPGGLAMGLLGPKVGRLFDAYGARVLVISGSVLLVLALAGFSRLSASTPPAWILILHVILSIGLALIFTPVFTGGLSDLPAHLYPHGSAILGTLQQVAAALGTALIVTIMTSRAGGLTAVGVELDLALGAGIRLGFGVAALIGVGVLILAFFLPTRVATTALAAEDVDALPEEIETTAECVPA